MDDASAKEKAKSQENEKEQDTASSAGGKDSQKTTGSPRSPKAKGKPPVSKTGSAQSTVSSAKSVTKKGEKTSAKGGPRAPSPKGSAAKGKGAKGGKKKQEEEKPDTSGVQENDDGLPEGVIAIFLASKTQEIFECRGDEDVTAENPLKLIKKEDILKDLFNRAAVCDFQPYKQIIQDYPADEILIGYDADFKYGQNFFMATTEEAKEKLLHPPVLTEDGVEIHEHGGAEEEAIVYKYIPPEPKDWVSQGSEREVVEESVTETRQKITMSVKRLRRHFGSACTFQDRNVADAKDGYESCPSYSDKSFDLKRNELNKATQAIPVVKDSPAQTEWKYPRNANTQYYPREFSLEEQQKILESPSLAEFCKSVVPRFELALQQNEIMDVFYDDWRSLADDDGSFGSKADNHLKEYQSFTDLLFSKEKTITAIDWHPTIKGVVAVSAGERMTFYDRIDNAAKVIMTPSLVLIWSFADPIHPQLLLEAPDDILCFQFSPTEPNIIAGGCSNGQVVLWDISQYTERLKAARGGGKKKTVSALPGFEDDNALDTPIVRYCAVSGIEHSHQAPVTDILWIPDHMEINRMGIPVENKSGTNVQVMTCGVDHSVLLWDTRPPKSAAHLTQHDKNKDKIQNPMGVPTTFKHLDLTWKPSLTVTLHKSEPGGDHSPTKFSLSERQGDRSSLEKDDDENRPGEKKETTGFTFTKPGSTADEKRSLKKVNTHIYVGTEDGEIVYVDWMPQKDQDTGKLITPKPDFYHSYHDGPINTMQRSPFFKDVVLCVGGWTFSLWKEGVRSGPILTSAQSTKKITGGHWSPSRPAVFYITKYDGSVDVWDLLDRTHEPSMSQSVSPAPITCIYPFQVTNKQQLLAVGDNSGTLHILDIPWSLRQPTPNEEIGMSNYFDREVKRRAFVVARWDFREKEKMEIEAEAKRTAGIAPQVVLTDEEILYRMKQEYQQYLDDEASFLRELGLKEEELEVLPPTD